MKTEMMKFRGYDKVEGKLYNSIGYIDFLNKKCQLAVVDENENCCATVERDFKDVILLRSTGKADYFGVKIYEGFIVADDEVLYVVEWSKEDAMFTLNTSIVSLNFSDIDSDCLEVVGNIFEDNHLIKEDTYEPKSKKL